MTTCTGTLEYTLVCVCVCVCVCVYTRADGDISGVLIGAGENNFLMRGGNVDVLRNVSQDTSVNITSARSPTCTAMLSCLLALRREYR